MEEKQLVKNRIQHFVHLYGIHMRKMIGQDLDHKAEEKRLYAEWEAGLITNEDIEVMISEHTDT